MSRAPECRNCDRPMEPATVPGDGQIGWYCLACNRFRPKLRNMTFNNHMDDD